MTEKAVKPPEVRVQIGRRIRAMAAHGLPATGALFRDAWRWPAGAGPIEVDLTRARDIVRERIREERAERWAAADAAFNIALDSGGNTAAASRARQALRDAPAHRSISDAATPAALAAITLDTILGS